MTLTITEKNHWKERIEAKIERRIKQLSAMDPDLVQTIKKQARSKVLKRMGLGADYAKLEALSLQIEQLNHQSETLSKSIYAKITGETYRWASASKSLIDDTLKPSAELHEDELLGQHQIGREILLLRQEKDSLLDTVWLATSNRQIKDLWQQVSTLLGDTPTELQRQAISDPAG